MTLIYKSLYRSTEDGNWQAGESREREVTADQFEDMKANSKLVGMTYSEKYNEFFMIHTDRLHATKITVR